MFTAVSYWFLGQAAKILPGILSKIFFGPAKAKAQFEIDLSGHGPVAIRLNSHIPEVEVRLRITNKGPIPISVDRILFQLWMGQPVVEFAELRRVLLHSQQTIGVASSRVFLSEPQRKAIESNLDQNRRPINMVMLHATVFCDCKVGHFDMSEHFQIQRDNLTVS